jgi:hypothetical protein
MTRAGDQWLVVSILLVVDNCNCHERSSASETIPGSARVLPGRVQAKDIFWRLCRETKREPQQLNDPDVLFVALPLAPGNAIADSTLDF